MISYGANLEDVILMRALGGIGSGFYIDIGASFPDQDSITKNFYDNGWSGVNIEPIAAAYTRLMLDRPRDVNLACALGSASGTLRMWDPGIPGLATGRPNIGQELLEAGCTVQPFDVPLRTLVDVWEEHVLGDVHFLKVDVEGMEADVLRGADFSRHRPWILLIESTHPNTTQETYTQWEPLVSSAGYLHVYSDGVNRFYVARERQDLVSAFRYPPNIFDCYKTSAQAAAEAAAEGLRKDLAASEATRRSLINLSRGLGVKFKQMEQSLLDLSGQAQKLAHQGRASTMTRQARSIHAQLSQLCGGSELH